MKNFKRNTENLREIKIEKGVLRFLFFKENSLQNEISIKVGSDYVCKNYFKGDMPKDDEVEISIYYVEETALSNKALMNNNEWFVCDHRLLPELFEKNVGDVISLAEVEEINHKYFDVIAGVPESVIQIKFTKEKFTLILILRALMHVLKFKQVEISE